MTEEKQEQQEAPTPSQQLAVRLRTPVGEQFVSERKGLSYVTGRYTKQSLNELFGPLGWSFVVLDSHCLTDNISESDSVRWYVHGRLTVTVNGTTAVKDGIAVGHGTLTTRTGRASAGRINEIIDFAAAEAVTDALKRAAVLLGQALGLSLYPLKAGDKPETTPEPKAIPAKATKRKTKVTKPKVTKKAKTKKVETTDDAEPKEPRRPRFKKPANF